MSQQRFIIIVSVASLLIVLSAILIADLSDRDVIEVADVDNADRLVSVHTDKAAYRPGDKVSYTLKLNPDGEEDGRILVRYRHLDQVISTAELPLNSSSTATWEWRSPEVDGKGYLTEIFYMENGKAADQLNIAVDVSRDWGHFPRYGFLSDFSVTDREERKRVVEKLNRYHLNGLQFYDWQYKHHQPIKWEGDRPAKRWPDIARRPVVFDTVQDYISLAHQYGMKAMNYNLLFGAYEDAWSDGVKKEWGLYQDPLHENIDRHPLPDSWASDIVLMDPSNPDWQEYLFKQERKVFDTLQFDGWHVDQLGDRGNRWTYDGQSVHLAATYAPFLKAAKQVLGVDLVMNAVSQFGQAFIASRAPLEFLYTEVWDSYPEYGDLKRIIDDNRKYSKGTLNTVLAAYMNYDHSNSPGTFNTPGVLLTNAVIFAAGGSHLELGEHMLSKEYFPHDALTMTEALEIRLIDYYDFLVAYENLLRDDVEEDGLLPVSGHPDVAITPSPEPGKIWSFTKKKADRHIMHLLNFHGVQSMEWRDTAGTRNQPEKLVDLPLEINASRKVAKVWMASPDAYQGSPVALDFKLQFDTLTITVPQLEYWTMIVVEYANE